MWYGTVRSQSEASAVNPGTFIPFISGFKFRLVVCEICLPQQRHSSLPRLPREHPISAGPSFCTPASRDIARASIQACPVVFVASDAVRRSDRAAHSTFASLQTGGVRCFATLFASPVVFNSSKGPAPERPVEYTTLKLGNHFSGSFIVAIRR